MNLIVARFVLKKHTEVNTFRTLLLEKSVVKLRGSKQAVNYVRLKHCSKKTSKLRMMINIVYYVIFNIYYVLAPFVNTVPD
jgi:hypothetical protein